MRRLLPLLLVACARGPEVELDQEAAAFPWDRLDGTIAYARTEETAEGPWTLLFAVNTDQRAMKIVRQEPAAQTVHIAFDPTGGWVGFSDFNVPSGLWQVYAAEVGDGAVAPLDASRQAHQDHPTWSAAGALAYWNDGPTGAELWVAGEPLVSGVRVDRTRAAWSKDGKRLIVSAESAASQGALYSVDVATKARTILRDGTGAWNDEIFSDPVFAPDGTRFAFARWGNAVSGSELWVMNADGTGAVAITTGEADSQPAWSPDSTQLAFVRLLEGEGPFLFVTTVGAPAPVRISAKNAATVAWR